MADEKKSKKEKLIAKKDFRIVQNEHDIQVREGDEIALSDIPEHFHENLKTEGVI